MLDVSPKGLSDRAEDVCAAAARGIRVVTQRFLASPPTEVEHGARRLGIEKPGDPGKSVVVVRGGFAFGTHESPSPSQSQEVCGETIFDLVWEALSSLDRDSSCIEVRDCLVSERCLGSLVDFAAGCDVNSCVSLDVWLWRTSLSVKRRLRYSCRV